VTLKCSSAEGSLITHVGKEAFITVLSDGNHQLEVIKCKPTNVEATLSHAIKVEAFEQSLAACQGTLVTDQDDGHAKHWSRVVCTVLDQSDSSEIAALCKRVDELQDALEQATKGFLPTHVLYPDLSWPKSMGNPSVAFWAVA